MRKNRRSAAKLPYEAPQPVIAPTRSTSARGTARPSVPTSRADFQLRLAMADTVVNQAETEASAGTSGSVGPAGVAARYICCGNGAVVPRVGASGAVGYDGADGA